MGCSGASAACSVLAAEEWGALFGGEVHDHGGGAGAAGGVGVRDAVDDVLSVGRELYSVGVLEVIEVGDLEGWAGGRRAGG